jgi:hypothetical protein
LVAGEAVNLTERRAALHMALRNLGGEAMAVDGRDVKPEVRAELEVFFPKAGALPAAARVLRNLPAGHEWPLWPPERLGDLDGDGVRGDGDRAAMAKSLGGAFVPARAILDFDGDVEEVMARSFEASSASYFNVGSFSLSTKP